MSDKRKPKAKKVSRHSTGADGVVGGPADLPQADLPLVGEVLAKAKQIKNSLTAEGSGRDVSNKAVVDKLYADIITVYKRANSNLVLVSEKNTKARLEAMYSEYKMLVRSGASLTAPKVVTFANKCNKLFDIVYCKCKILQCLEVECGGCEPAAHIKCKCSSENKIPELELAFVYDQRKRQGNKGNMQMGGLDKKVTADMQEALELKVIEDNENNNSTTNIPLVTEAAKDLIDGEDLAEDIDDEEDDSDDEEDDSDDEFVPTMPKNKETSQTPSHNQNRMSLKNLSRECMRWGISPKAGAAIANAAYIDAEVVTKENQKNVIDKNKLKRQMAKYQEELRTKQMAELRQNPPEGIYFDGKKDNTLNLEKDERGVWKIVLYNEEHYTLGIEPGAKYLGHLEPESGKAVEISDSIINYLRDNGIDGGWKVVGSDSTSCITGNMGGVICLLERALGRRLYWSICLLHINELPFRNLFITLDGPTSGSNSFSGPVGKLFPNVADMDWNPKFKPISDGPGLEDLPDKVFRDLSSDQKYLRLAVLAVMTGAIPDQLKSLTCGPICHSRWLTLCSTLLAMYMKKSGLKGKSKKNLEIFVFFIITNYAPMWFTIKSKPSITQGPRHYYKQVQLIKILPKQVQNIVKENISRSAFHAHPENLLLSMLADDSQEVRTKAVEQIIRLREDSDNPDKGDISVRKFVVPEINYECTNYTEMIDFEKETVFEPNLTADLSIEDLENIKVERLSVEKFSNNNQGVERLVKETSRACERVVGWASRDGFLRASAKSRSMMPKFISKQDYQNNFE